MRLKASARPHQRHAGPADERAQPLGVQNTRSVLFRWTHASSGSTWIICNNWGNWGKSHPETAPKNRWIESMSGVRHVGRGPKACSKRVKETSNAQTMGVEYVTTDHGPENDPSMVDYSSPIRLGDGMGFLVTPSFWQAHEVRTCSLGL